MNIVCICSVLSLHYMISSALPHRRLVDDNPETREKYALFYCYKLRTCTPGGDKVCGYDESQASLAEFEDLCTLYKVNCEKRGMYTRIDAPICEGQKKFLSESHGYGQLGHE